MDCLYNQNKLNLNEKEDDFIESKKYLSIYFLTWNVGSIEPLRLNFNELFAINHRQYDSYIIVLEELSMKTFLLINEWLTALELFFQKYNYILLKKETSILTGLFFFVRRNDLYRYSSIKTYPLTIQGDRAFSFKGIIALRFVYNKIKIAVIGAHLTPHDENYDKRIKDLRYIMSEITFSNQSDTIFNQDITFLLGDLNFRLNSILNKTNNFNNNDYNEEEEFNSITQFIRENELNYEQTDRFETLLKYDQIRYAIKNGDALKDYEETSIQFPPTFKFIVGQCNKYDNKRRPAWTDRILWRNILKIQSKWHNIDDNRIELINPIGMYYNSLPQYTSSDHKPVRQLIWLPINEMKKLKQEISKQRRQRRNSLPLSFFVSTQNFIHNNNNTMLRSESLQTIDEEEIGTKKLSATNHQHNNNDDDNNDEMNLLTKNLSSTSISNNNNNNNNNAKIPNKNSIWLNIDDPELFQPQYRIEFFRIPDWNITKKFYANFRIVKIIDNDDNTTTTQQQVSINDPYVKHYLSVWDWIGIYPENFRSITDFITYSFPKFGHILPTEQAMDALQMLDIYTNNFRNDNDDDLQGDNNDNENDGGGVKRSSSSSSSTSTSSTSSSSDNNTDHQQQTSSNDVFSVYFDENTPILAGRYVLVYVRRDDDVIGMSEVFTIERNIDLSNDY